MRIHTRFEELFGADPVPTESQAFQLLLKRPLDADVDYVAVPWSVVINRNLLGRSSPLRVRNGFTVCQHIRFLELVQVFADMGIHTVFSPHVEFAGFNPQLLPFPHYAVHGALPAADKDIFYSFIGARTTRGALNVREAIFSIEHPSDAVVIARTTWHWAGELGWARVSKEQQASEALEYRTVLSRSRFALCPKGTGPGTIRFWEALQAGAIPVLLSDTMVLPTSFDWERCVLRIPEHQVVRLRGILEGISVSREQQMRDECLRAYDAFSGENFVGEVRRQFP